MKNFKGLFKDTTYEKNPEATWQNAKGILLTEKFNTPVNENGTKHLHTIRGKLLGVIETNLHIVYFSKLLYITGENSLITLYDRNADTLEEVLVGNFGFNRPIEGIYKYDFEGNLIVAWCDGVFEDSTPPKIVKLTNIDLPLIGITLTDTYLNLINLFPDIIQGSFDLDSIDGAIDGVYAYVTFKYVFKDDETVFKDVNSGISLNKSLLDNQELISKGFEINFKDLAHTVYDSIIIGLYIIGEEEDIAYESERIGIESDTLAYKIQTLNNFKIIDAQDIVVTKDRFSKAETITEHKDSVMLGHVSKEEPFKFQKYANLLQLDPVSHTEAEVVKSFDLQTKQVMLYGEVYAAFVQLDLVNGETTDWYHIPNLNYAQSELVDYWTADLQTKYQLALNQFDDTLSLKRFHLENLGDTSKFGLWQNEETYPQSDDYDSTIDYDGNPLAGTNLKGQKVTHHRVMNEPEDEHFTGNVNPIVGARISNWSAVPVNVRSKIKGIRLGFAKRDLGNSLIISNGVLLPAWSPQDEKAETDANIPYDKIETSLQGTTYQTASNMGYRSFSRAQFISAETELYKPKLDFNMVMVNYIARTFVSSGGVAILEDNVHNDIYTGYERDLDVNRYWYGHKSYDYKLPNNSATGSNFLDGGLFINFVKNRRDLNYYNEVDFATVTDGFLGSSLVVGGGLFTRPTALDNKTLFLEGNNSNYHSAGVSLMNIRDNLYNLNASKIVSSTNTLNNLSVLETGNGHFFMGDVQISDINVNYKISVLDWVAGLGGASTPTEDTEIKTCPLTSKVYSPLLSSKVSSSSVYALNIFDEISGDLEVLNSLDYGFDVNVNEKYAVLNDLAGYLAFNHKNRDVNIFPYRIIRSAIIPNENFIANAMRTFFADAYFETVRNKGDIVALRSNDKEVYIQLRFELLYAKVRDVLTSENGDTYLTVRDIFERDPEALSIKKEGYIGSEHKFSCKMTKAGYLTIDHQQGNIILAKPEVRLITTGVRNFMKETLEFESTYREVVNNTSKAVDNPFDNIGFAVGVDERFNRLFITKLYPPTLIQVSSEERTEYVKNLLGNSASESVDFPVYEDNYKSFTFSFSLDVDFWVCEHPFTPSLYWNFKNDFYALKNHVISSNNTKGIIHEVNKGLKGVYFGHKEESYIDLIFNEGEGSRSLFSLSIDTINKKNEDFPVIVEELTERTIDAIVVFNEHQCSGRIDLPLEDYDKIRDAEGMFNINNFRDIVINRFLPIINNRGVIKESNLDFNKNWFDKSYFIGTFIVVRLIWKNEHQGSVYVNEAKALSKVSKR